MLRITQLKININEFYKENKEKIESYGWKKIYGEKEVALVKNRFCKIFRCKPEDIKKFNIVKCSIDARKKQEIYYNYCIEVELPTKIEKNILNKEKQNRVTKSKRVHYCPINSGKINMIHRPVIVGFGPAGMFCALSLARAGFMPIVLEQGQQVEKRKEQVEKFWAGEELDLYSNVQFGEGGAGTFSDGKLNTLVKDVSGRNQKVLEMFVEHGAPKEILYMQKPHIGTDRLCEIVKSIREEIIALGGEVRFESKVTDLRIENNKVTGLEWNHEYWMDVEVLVLAIGHSARETFHQLYTKGISMEQKPFAIGVRIEHKQEMIDKNQYGDLAGILPAADYKLTYQSSNGRSLFSFCMCPGGYVVNASSEREHLVVNGMSNYARDEENANSALVVNINPEDLGSDFVLAGIEFQRKWERLAYQCGKGKIPVQLWKDFKNKRISKEYGDIKHNIKGLTTFGNLWDCLPQYVCETLLEGISYFGEKIKGYDREDALMSGVETRTSSPVRILRGEKLESNIEGIYPCGEGAGYAGGITSAAMDGLKIFEAIITKYQKPNN